MPNQTTLAPALRRIAVQPNDALRAEWTFGPLLRASSRLELKSELLAAIHYEYARESISIRNLVERHGDATQSDLADTGHPNAWFVMKLMRFWNCICWPEFFPHTPWLRIPTAARIKRVASFVKSVHPKQLVRINERTLKPWELPKRGARFFWGSKENVVLQIDWAAGNNKAIIAALSRWVRNSRPSVGGPRTVRSRGNVNIALLRRLGVMRLLHHYRFSDAVMLAEQAQLKMPNQQSAALQLRRQVMTDLHQIFQSNQLAATGIVLIPSDELPFNWLTATQRRRI